MVGNAPLEIRPVRRELDGKLALDLLANELQQGGTGGMPGQLGGAEGKPHQVVQVVVVATPVSIDLQVVENELGVPHDRPRPRSDP